MSAATPLSRVARLTGLALLVLCSVPLEAGALRPCPRNPPAVAIWPTYGAADVPADASLFVWMQAAGHGGLEITLRDTTAPAKVELTTEPAGIGLLQRLRPRAPLTPGHAYALSVHVAAAAPDEDAPLPHKPAPQDWLLAPFTTSAVAAKADSTKVVVPKLGAARVRFGEWADFNGDMAHLRNAGRDADLLLDKAMTGTAVVLLRGTYTSRELYEPRRWEAAFGAASELNIASTGGVPCTLSGPPRAPAPKSGTYRLELVPVSAQGVEGKAVVVEGRIGTGG